MIKKDRIQEIIILFKKQKRLKTSEILDYFKNEVERTTIYRDLKKLIEDWKIKEVWKWIYESQTGY